MVHVSHVCADLKGGVDTDLGEKTLIVGPNGRGKSAVVNAVELALGGSASDIVGRAEVRRESDLLALGDGSGLSVTATLSDGRVATWETKSTKGGGAKKAKHVKPIRSAFPVREVREALGGSSDTARSWLLGRIAADVTREQVVSWFDADQQARYEAWAAGAKQVDEIDLLLGATAGLGAELRANRAESKALEATIKEIGSDLSAEPTRAALDAMEHECSALWTKYQTALKRAGAAESGVNVDELRAAAESLIQQYDRAQVALEHMTADMSGVAPLSEMDDRVVTTREALIASHDLHTSNGLSHCLVCAAPGPVDHQGRADSLARANADLLARRERWRWLDAKKAEAKGALSIAQGAIDAFHAAAKAAEGKETDKGAGAAAETLETQWRAAHDEFNRCKAAASRWEAARSKKERIDHLKRDSRDLDSLLDATKSAIDRLLKHQQQQFVRLVGSYLLPTDEFALELERGGKPVCRFGLVRDGTLHTALSGAEWARLTLALACAASAAEEPDVLRVFTPEERAFDPHTLNGVLRALTNAPGQVILTSPVRPKGRIPKGWTIVDVDASPTE